MKTCKSPGCYNLFKIKTHKQYCSMECRKKDRMCSLCGVRIPFSQPGTKNGHCNNCMAENARRYRKKNPRYGVSYHRRRKYGITQEDYDQLWHSQNGLCAICGLPEEALSNAQVSREKMLAIDHDHESGQIRGLLCNKCNTALGLLKENQQSLRNMLDYLEKYSK